MFTALYFKEWREKALLFFFELGILVLLLAAQFIFREKRDVQEWLVYAVLLLFFPFAALILGAAGFEAEYRQGAWAYLFSRPVRKPVIWLAKFSTLLSMLGALWLVFLAAWLTLPGIRELSVGARILLGFTVESGFAWWSVWFSVFLLTVAFSLSLLHERQFNILFLALIVGLILPAAAWAILASMVGGFLAWVAPSKALATFLVSQILIALAFAAASVLTLARSDFSQSRKQTRSFVRWVLPLLLLALAGTAAWALLTPVRGEHYLSFFNTSAGEPYYISERGIFKYSTAEHRIQWMAKAKFIEYFVASAAGGKVAYTAFDIKSRSDIIEELWVANADGSGRKRIIGRGPRENEWPQEVPITHLMMSPDGAKVAILAARWRPGQSPALWIVNTDGTRLEKLPDDPALFGNSAEGLSIWLVAWAQGGNAILLSKISGQKPFAFSFWLYDLDRKAARIVLDNAARASWLSSLSPRGDCLALKYQKSPEAPWRLALLDVKTLATTDINGNTDGTVRGFSGISWDQKGDRLAYVARKAQAEGPDAYVLAIYSLADHKTVAEKVMTKSESEALRFSPSWTADGARLLVLDRETNGLKVFDRELSEVDRVPLPAWMTSPTGLVVVGDQALIEEDKTDSLWRLDLGKKSWKKLY
jgi:hypothetical protein